MIKTLIKKILGTLIVPLLLSRENEIQSKENAVFNLENTCSQKESMIHRHNVLCPNKDIMIIIPVHNVENYVEKCIDSVINQKTKYTMDIFIVENGSTDESKKIIEKYRRIDDIHVVSITETGAAAARNYALQQLTGNYILFLDADDYLSENAVDVLLNAAYKYNVDIVEGNCIFFDNKGKILHRTNHLDSTGNNVSSKEMFGQPWGKVIKSDLFENLIFPENFWFEDSIMTWYIYPSSKNIITISDIVYYYRNNPQGYTSSVKKNPKAIESLWLTEKMIDDVLENKQFNDEYYEIYLNQVIVNLRRISGLGKKIEKSAFYISADTLKRLNYNCKTKLSYKMKLLERILKRGYYDAFKVLLKCWIEM